MYGNEREVGEAVRKSDLARDDVFVTSKLNNDAHDPSGVPAALDRTLEALGFDVLDLFLIHWPMPAVGDYVETWRAMTGLLDSGRVRAVGVSNFQPEHLQRLLDADLAVPAVNQVEVHPFFRQDAVRAFGVGARHRDRGVVADRPWRRARRSDHRRDRRPHRPDAGAGDPAVAPAAGRRGLPEVGHAEPHGRELRRVRVGAERPRTCRRSTASTATSGADRTPPRSTASDAPRTSPRPRLTHPRSLRG